ncbi:MAG: carbohydrate ABC transporter permease [Phycisphaerae bacterium]|nr:carbohydrate ABC transporter permease [Phycisphaerae bacterium]
MPRDRRDNTGGRGAWPTLVLWLCGAAFALPLVWMVAGSVRPAPGSSAGVLGRAAENYAAVWADPTANFPRYLRNSLLIAGASTLGMVAASAVTAFGLSRLCWRGRDAVFLVLLATLMIPGPVLVAPQYLLMRELGLIGTLAPLWLPAWFGGAFSVFLLRQFFLTIPRDLDEAARLDGCSTFGVFWRVVLPLSKPALASAALFQVVASWNDFLGPLVFLNHRELYTLPLGLQQYQSQHGGTPWNLVMAATTLTVLPVMAIYALTRRWFVEGSGAEGLKE